MGFTTGVKLSNSESSLAVKVNDIIKNPYRIPRSVSVRRECLPRLTSITKPPFIDQP